MMSSNIATSNSIVDNSWCLDLGVTHHFTPSYSILASTTLFTRLDQVIVESGKTISISHVGCIVLPSSSHSLLLNHTYNTLVISNNLISVSKLCRDNKAFVEFHLDYFLMKDQDTHNILLQGHNDHGFYRVYSPPSFPSHSMSLSNSKALVIQTKDTNI